ncbi:MAG: type VI secretion system lipoprotein TssJ [Azoarcus sp.]|jgi:type VI secretion system protein VasD|nr:type VI secretion system lipoprotein TssJ [Azoarcus sp.]
MHSRAGRTVVYYYFLCILTGALLSGCGLFGTLKLDEREKLPLPLEISLGAAERVNPNVEGRPSPIVVRTFELSNDTRFLAADYFELMGQDGAPLGDELLVSEEFILLPGEVRMVRKRAEANSKFLGIVAGYRDLNGSVWRAIAALPEPYLAGRVWSNSVSPTKRFYVILGEKGAAIYEEQPKQ